MFLGYKEEVQRLYPQGFCPWCKKEVQPDLADEQNLLWGRNVLSCPECLEKILVCSKPGCDNYARWGEFYDDKLCPKCKDNLPGGIATLAGLALTAFSVLALTKRINN